MIYTELTNRISMGFFLPFETFSGRDPVELSTSFADPLLCNLYSLTNEIEIRCVKIKACTKCFVCDS